MRGIVELMLLFFHASDRIKAQILEELIFVLTNGFSEAYNSIAEILTGNYLDRTAQELAIIIMKHKADLRNIYQDYAYSIRHASFAGVFEDF
jgi:hypothetical protein